MVFTISSWIAYVVAWAGFAGGVWLLFEKGEEVASQDTKDSVKNWLRKFPLTRGLPNWPSTFSEIFDRVFGKRALSFHRVLASCIASIGSVLLLSVLWFSLRHDEALAFLTADDLLIQMAMLFGAGLILNLIPDYLSLIETRLILTLMSRCHHWISMMALVVIDALLTIVIIFIAFVLTTILIAGGSEVSYVLTKLLTTGLTLSSEPGEPSLGIYFYSTFFTSIWVYLYVLSAFIAHIFAQAKVGAGSVIRLLDIDNKPIRCLGYISIMLVTVFFLILPIVRLAISVI